MQEISVEESKQIMLKMLGEIDAFCRKNDIVYFLTGGTLIGAIRYNGFIPWDDDIDIALMRKDYERLLKEFKSSSGDVEILNYKNKTKFIWPAAKIVNNKTVLIESNVIKAAIGIYLDMFPLDYVPGNYEQAKRYVQKVFRWKNLLTIKYMRISKSRAFIKNVLVLISKILYLVPDELLIKRIEVLSRRFENQNDCKYICNMSGAWGIRELASRKDFEYSIEGHFEGKEFMIPVGYDDYLTAVYGNYMVPPPENKRISTHTSKAYWRRPD